MAVIGNSLNARISTRYGDGVFSNGKNLISGRFCGKNRLINGDQSCWQRGAGGRAIISVSGTTTASVTKYSADRWQLQASSNQSAQAAQIAGNDELRFMAQVTNVSGTGSIKYGQCLTNDMISGCAGNPISLSFWAMKTASFSALNNLLIVRIYSGTNANDVSNISRGFAGLSLILDTTITLSNTLSYFTFNNLNVPSGVTQLSVEFSYTATVATPANANADGFILGNVQLEQSPNASVFERLKFGETLDFCSYFYQKSYIYSVSPATNNSSAGVVFLPSANAPRYNFIGFVPLIQEMRVTPTLSVYSFVASLPSVVSTAGGVDLASGSGTSVLVNDKSFALQNSSTGTLNQTYGGFLCHWTGEAEVT